MPQLVLHVNVTGGAAAAATVNAISTSFAALKSAAAGSSTAMAAGMAKMAASVGYATRAFNFFRFIVPMALGALLIAAFDTATAFEQQMQNVASVCDATAGQMRTLSTEARKWSVNSVYSASQVAHGMYALASAGQKWYEVMQSIGGVIVYATATQTGLEAAAEGVVQALAMFRLEASETNKVVNIMAAGISYTLLKADRLREALGEVGGTAHALNYGLDRTVALLGLLHNAGAIGSDAGTRLKNTLIRLAYANETMHKILPETYKRVLDLGEAMDLLKERSVSVGDVFRAFGRIAGPAVMVLMEMGGKEIDEMTRRMNESNKAWDMYKQQMNTVKASFTMMKHSLQETFIAGFSAARNEINAAIKALTVGIRGAVVYVAGFIKWMVVWIQHNEDAARSVVKVAGYTFVLVAAFRLLSSAFSMVYNTGLFVVGLFQVLHGAVQFVYSALRIFTQFLLTVLLPGIVSFFRGTWAVLQAFRSGWVAQWLAMHLAAALPWVGLGLLIAAALAIVLSLVIRYREQIKDAFVALKDFFVWLGGKIKDIFWGPIKFIYEKMLWLRDNFMMVVDRVFPGLSEALGKVGAFIEDKARDAGGAIASGLGEAWEWTKGKAQDAAGYAGGKLDELKAKFQAWKDELKGLGAAGAVNLKLEMPDMGPAVDPDAIRRAEDAMTQWRDTQKDQNIASMLYAISREREYTKGWLEEKSRLITTTYQYVAADEGTTQTELAEATIKRDEDLAAARMAHEDAVIEHYRQGHRVQMAMLAGVEAAYDTFFETITDMEMSGKERREAMWEESKKAFMKGVGQMMKDYIVQHLRAILVASAAEGVARKKSVFAEAKLGAIKAYQAFAAIPFIGPFLGAIAAAAAFTFLMAFGTVAHKGGSIGQGGAGLLRSDERIIRGQVGEYVIKRDSSRSIGRPVLDYMNATGRLPASAPAVSFNIVVNAGSESDELREAIEDRVVPILEDLIARRRFVVREAA